MQRFDQVTKLFAEHRFSRRSALAAGATGAAGLAFNGNGSSAQSATPEPVDPFGGSKETMFLFVQSFQSGRLEPVERGAGPYRLGFSPLNPPNAALIAETGEGEEEILVIELVNPVYDAETREVSYDVRILDDSDRVGMTFLHDHHTGAHEWTDYGVSHLFIDDCASQTISCALPETYAWGGDLGAPLFCWDSANGCCAPCVAEGAEFWNQQCNETFSNACNGGCTAYVPNGGWCAGGPGGPAPTCETKTISCAAPTTYAWVGDWGGPLFCMTDGCCAPCYETDPAVWDDNCNQAFPDACQGGCTAYVANGEGCLGGPGYIPYN
jgi:hypothetical protein